MGRVEKLIGAMRLPEKLGQLTMTAAPYAVTGPYVAGDLTADIRSGAVGNLLNLYGPEMVAQTQRLAVQETRLGIPLLIGLDVIHGHCIQFPVPLGRDLGTSTGICGGGTCPGSSAGGPGRWRGDDLRPDVRCLPRPPLGPDCRRARRRCICGRCPGQGKGERFSGRRAGGLRQAFRGLWRGDGGAGICQHRYLRTDFARSASARLRSRNRKRRDERDARLHRTGRHTDDRPP